MSNATQITKTKTDLEPIAQTDYYGPMYMMLEDYNDSKSGELLTINGDRQSEEDLSALRRSIANFCIAHEIDLDIPARELGLEVDKLLEDLEKDEVLIKVADEYRERVNKTPIDSSDLSKVKVVKLPTMSEVDVARAFSRLGFTEESRSGSHAKLKKEESDGTFKTLTVPLGHKGDIDPKLLRKIITKDAGLGLEEFLNAL